MRVRLRRPLLRRARGFSLIELMMTLGISGLVITGMMAAFISQAQQYQVHAGRRAAQAHGRQGILFMERELRQAGYGVEPWLALTPYDGFNARLTPPAGAYQDNYPDAVTVAARNLYFARGVDEALTTSGRLVFETPLTEDNQLLRGQVMLILACAATRWTYVTVGAPSGPAPASSVTLESVGAATETPITGPGARWHGQGQLDTEPCFDRDGAVAVRVDRKSFFVASFPEHPGDPQADWTPYLLLHEGTDKNLDGSINLDDAVPLADNIEQLQLAYVLNTTDWSEPIVKGSTPGEVWAWGTAWDNALTRPPFTVSYLDDRRRADHPANIRQVRLTLVARGQEAIQQLPGNILYTPGETWVEGEMPSGTTLWRQLENVDGVLPAPFDPSAPGYIRQSMRLTVSPKNLLMRSQFKPVLYGGG